LIPYDIEEPIFVGKIGGRNVLLHLLSSDLTVVYIEDLDLARHKEMMAQARATVARERDEATEQFVNEAVKNFGTREKAGAAACMLGWTQLHKGALDDALNRFKQAQLFDPRNGEGFWGEGVTILFMVGREKRPIDDMREVIRLEEKAFAMLPNNSRMMGDLANAYSNLAKLTPENQAERRKELLDKAAALCEKSSQIEPGYGQIYFLWAIALMEQGKYREAWEKMEKARQLKADMSADIVENLKKRMPDPYERKGPERDGAKPVSPTESRRGADARGRPSP
jgi:tetratricopeptide (TPR) repeat protein